jgi:hypothetical protein
MLFLLGECPIAVAARGNTAAGPIGKLGTFTMNCGAAAREDLRGSWVVVPAVSRWELAAGQPRSFAGYKGDEKRLS